MSKLLSREFCFLSLLAITLVTLAVGCDSGENTVVQPENREPTAEETAAYEKEIEEMNRERD